MTGRCACDAGYTGVRCEERECSQQAAGARGTGLGLGGLGRCRVGATGGVWVQKGSPRGSLWCCAGGWLGAMGTRL